ncbi:hypothetical protein [Streptomyces natalensis]|uniref:Uncharacterized protein n=1 Tax=Streptomyces natalensis ATCC 27448 TaxID=1240678 RepID=A0A0D7CIB8_9ACTN|nr:hypothetical protein [Streptomyces natalensis]KIZ15610.1 hypothetical protein SNA_25595 [Streptomyces natalensis ATCC 27448]
MNEFTMPRRIFAHMEAGFVVNEGTELAQEYKQKGDVAHPGGPFGNVFAWLWEQDQDHAMSLLTDLLVAARRAAPDGHARLVLDDLLDYLPQALPDRLAPQYDLIKATAQRNVPKWFGGDPNQP